LTCRYFPSDKGFRGEGYTYNNQVKIVRPDFIFFSAQPDGTIAADIVDPHGTHLSDALPKLQGLATYAETHSMFYRRIKAIAKVGDKLRAARPDRPSGAESCGRGEGREESLQRHVGDRLLRASREHRNDSENLVASRRE